MKLITELTEEVNFLTEEVDGQKNYFLEGIILQGNIKNKNKRIYPFDILQKESHRYMTEVVANKRAYGELNHPDSPQINLDRVSHLFTELRSEGTNIVGKARVVDTPCGSIVRGLLEGGANLGISSRGVGSVKNRDGVSYVQEDFKLATAGDIVADPSAPDAFVQGIMEGVEWIYNNGMWSQETIEESKRLITDASARNLQEKKIEAFEKMLKTL